MAGRPLCRESSDYYYRRDSESGWLDARALAGLGLGLPLQQQQQQQQQQMTTRAETDKIVADIDASPVPASRARSQGAGTAPTGGGATGAETADCSYNRRKLQNSQAARRFRAKRKEELKRMREEIATLKRENGEAQRLLTEVRKFCHAKDVGLRDFPALHDIDCLLAAWEEEDRNQSDNDASSSRSVDGPAYQSQSVDMTSSLHHQLQASGSQPPGPPNAVVHGPGMPSGLALSPQQASSPLLAASSGGMQAIRHPQQQQQQAQPNNAFGDVQSLQQRPGASPGSLTAAAAAAAAASEAGRDGSNHNHNHNHTAASAAVAAAAAAMNQRENGMGSGRGVECTGSATNGDAPGPGHASGNNKNNNNNKTFVPPQSMKSQLVLSPSNVPVGASAPTNSPVLAASTGLTAPAHAPSPLQGPSGLPPGQSQALFDLFNLQAGGHDAAAYPMASSLLKQMAGPGSSSITRLESKIAELERRLMERIAELPEKFGGSNDAASNKRQRRAATSS